MGPSWAGGPPGPPSPSEERVGTPPPAHGLGHACQFAGFVVTISLTQGLGHQIHVPSSGATVAPAHTQTPPRGPCRAVCPPGGQGDPYLWRKAQARQGFVGPAAGLEVKGDV